MTYQIPELLKGHENLIQGTFRYSYEIRFKREETKPWESKLGGCPYLKSIEDYPTDEDGNPMLFLAQINLADLENLDELPEKGLLQFFVANDDLFGLEDPIRVLYIEDYEENEDHLVTKHPYENDEYKRNLPFSHNGKMYFTSREMPMSSSLDLFQDTFMNKLSEIEYEQLSDDCYSSDSRIGGYPYFVQNDDIGFDDGDFLLLQLDIDEDCGIMFGDSGNCVFSIPKEALKKRDFSKVVYDWQCC